MQSGQLPKQAGGSVMALKLLPWMLILYICCSISIVVNPFGSSMYVQFQWAWIDGLSTMYTLGFHWYLVLPEGLCLFDGSETNT